MRNGCSVQSGASMSGEDDLTSETDIDAEIELEDVALTAVDDAINAVENQETPPTDDVENSPENKPTSSIPEIDDVENVEEMLEVLLNMGEERSRKNDVKGALQAFNKAIALDPSSDMAWFNRGVLLEAQQDARGARQSFQICLDLNEEHAPATANMAILLERIGDLEGAYSMANRALGFFPGHPALVELKERCRNSDISVPMEVMEPSIPVSQTFDMKQVEKIAEEKGIEDPEALLNEAVHHDHDADNELTQVELESAAEVVIAQQTVVAEQEIVVQPAPEIVPDLPVQETQPDIDSMVEEATEHLKQGNAKEALALLKPHLKTIGAKHAPAWRIAGGSMARLNLDDHAIAAMTHAQNLEPEHAPGWFNLGSVQQRKGLIKDAMNAYQRSLEADSAYLKAAEKLNALSLEQGFIESYLDSSRRILAMDSTHPVKNGFVTMLIDLARGENQVMDQVSGLPPTLPAGPDMAKEAIAWMSEEPSELHAQALSLSLQHSDAVLMWKQLIQQDGNNSNLWRGLAHALEQAGDLETAQKCHAKAKNIDGDASAIPDVQTTVEPAIEHQLASPPEGEQEPEPAASHDALLMPEPVLDQPSVPEPVVAEVATSQANDLLMTPREVIPSIPAEAEPEVDLAKAALDAAQTVARTTPQSISSNAISNQDVAWFNQGIQLIDDGKYKEALSCFDKALPAFADDDAMIIRILNNRGNAYYFLEEYPKCVESYHQAMLIRPTEVRGETLYNMGTAYAEMERYNDAIKCFEQAIPRGLDTTAARRAKDQIRRCNILQKAIDKKQKRR